MADEIHYQFLNRDTTIREAQLKIAASKRDGFYVAIGREDFAELVCAMVNTSNGLGAIIPLFNAEIRCKTKSKGDTRQLVEEAWLN